MREVKFLEDCISSLLTEGKIDTSDSILVLGSRRHEMIVLNNLGFTNVLLSNIVEPKFEVEFFKYEIIDALNISCKTESYDYVFIANTLHHLISPHRGVYEMMRVAKKGIFFLEAHDCMLMRLLVSAKFTYDYEVKAKGGLHGSELIPNYVYRWSKREIKKTICSLFPLGPCTYTFKFGLHLPMRGKARIIGLAILPLLMILKLLHQTNGFFVFVKKPLQNQYYPWIKEGAREEYKQICEQVV
jgi:hypothetical protein